MSVTSPRARFADADAEVAAEVDARAGEPPRGRGRRVRRGVALLAAVLVVAGVLTWVVAFSPLLGVRSVQTRGLDVLSATQVRAAAQVVAGTPLVRLDTAAVARRVETLPLVASAAVTTHFPSTVVISVRERTPVGYVRTGGSGVLVDRTGQQYLRVTAVPVRLPRFAVPTGAGARRTGAAMATVAAALPAAVLRRVDSVQGLDPSAITLVMHSGRIVHWGSAARSAAKARILGALLGRSSQVIDVSNPNLPFTR